MTAQQRAADIRERYGRTFAEELGIPLERNTPSPLFRLLCFALLASARIGHDIALRAARALTEAGWTTPARMRESTWERRTSVLNRSGYARYDESTARMLEATATRLVEDYGGDLRRLRRAADGDIGELRRLLKAFKGIGDVGADLFLREVQIAWDEVYPFADERVRSMAEQHQLPRDPIRLARLADDRRSFVRLVDGLVRAGFDA